jgi:hypothetical protein
MMYVDVDKTHCGLEGLFQAAYQEETTRGESLYTVMPASRYLKLEADQLLFEVESEDAFGTAAVRS